jgi:hypothetical protein
MLYLTSSCFAGVLFSACTSFFPLMRGGTASFDGKALRRFSLGPFTIFQTGIASKIGLSSSKEDWARLVRLKAEAENMPDKKRSCTLYSESARGRAPQENWMYLNFRALRYIINTHICIGCSKIPLNHDYGLLEIVQNPWLISR